MYFIELLKKILLNQYTIVGFSTFIGAITAFGANWLKEYYCNKNNEKEIIIKYFYNLHFSLRNISIFYCTVCNLHNIIENENSDINVNIPIENIVFDFQEEKLNFISIKKPILYESILQLKTEICSLKELSIMYNEKRNKGLLSEINTAHLELCPKLIQTMKNINKYLIKYYKTQDFIKDNIKDNIEKINNEFIRRINDQKQNILQNNKDLTILNKLEEIESIVKGWEVEI